MMNPSFIAVFKTRNSESHRSFSAEPNREAIHGAALKAKQKGDDELLRIMAITDRNTRQGIWDAEFEDSWAPTFDVLLRHALLHAEGIPPHRRTGR